MLQVNGKCLKWKQNMQKIYVKIKMKVQSISFSFIVFQQHGGDALCPMAPG